MDKVIDFEYLHGADGACVVKEIAILCVTEPELYTKTFKRPYSWRRLPLKVHRQNTWVSTNLMHIRWDEGEEPYTELVPFIRSCASTNDRLFVKGKEKAAFLSTLLNQHVHELGEFGCPRSRALASPNQRNRCCHLNLSRLHRFNWNCAIIKCHLFANWMKERLPLVPYDVAM